MPEVALAADESYGEIAVEGRHSIQSPSQLALRSLPPERAECRSALPRDVVHWQHPHGSTAARTRYGPESLLPWGSPNLGLRTLD